MTPTYPNYRSACRAYLANFRFVFANGTRVYTDNPSQVRLFFRALRGGDGVTLVEARIHRGIARGFWYSQWVKPTLRSLVFPFKF